MFYVSFYDVIMSLAWKKLQNSGRGEDFLSLCVIIREEFANATQNKAPLWSLIFAEYQICVPIVTTCAALERHNENLF